MNLLALAEKFSKKHYTTAQQANIMGDISGAFLAHAADDNLREHSASGGAVTAILLHLLESGQIDGALVNEAYVEDGVVKNRFLIAANRADLLRAQGSKYMAVRFSAQALPLIRQFDGRLAVVALPCDSTILRAARQRDEALAQKVVWLISLFCGHNSLPELTQRVIGKQTRGKDSPLTAFQYRVGHWRGEMRLSFADDSQTMVPFESFSTYQNLFFFCEKKCLYCHDHFGYDSDISAGDVWLSAMKEAAVKPTALLARSPRSVDLYQSCIDQGVLQAEAVEPSLILQSQARSVRGHYNLSARSKAGKLLGMKIPDTLHEKVNLFDWLTAMIILFNYRLSTKAWGKRLIFALPRPVLKLYLYLFKGIESL
jgi:coenzyme F420-reducing hydrogenase beta subunit